ncbi:MAG: diguanylate cyclase domain-containing protein [Gaiellaceae bacterium]
MSAAALTAVRPELTVRRWVVWAGVVGGGCVVVPLAVHTLVISPPTVARAGVGATLLFLGAAAGERWTLPMPNGEQMSLSLVATVAAAVLYGAAVAAIINAAAYLVVDAVHRREHPLKLAFNAGAYALGAGAAGLAADTQAGGVMGAALLAAAAGVAVNVSLVALMTTNAHMRPAAVFARTTLRNEILLPSVLALSVAPLFVIVWQSHPAVALLAVAPVVAVGMQLRAADERRHATALSLTDPLTGLGNRRALVNRLDRELNRADETGASVSVCMLDLDGFKEINDTRGHDAGDRALAAVAEVLRRDGEAFRYGGDEFMLVLPGRTRADAEAVGNAIRARVHALDIEPGPLSVSVGIATYANDGTAWNDLISAADSALYAGKTTTR